MSIMNQAELPRRGGLRAPVHGVFTCAHLVVNVDVRNLMPLVPGACRDAGCAYQMRGDYALPPAAMLQDVYNLAQRSVVLSA